MKTYYTQEEVQKIIELAQTMIDKNHYSSEREKRQKELDKVTLSIDERLAKWLEDKSSYDRVEQDGLDLLNEVLEALRQQRGADGTAKPLELKDKYFAVEGDVFRECTETQYKEKWNPELTGGGPVQPCGETLI